MDASGLSEPATSPASSKEQPSPESSLPMLKAVGTLNEAKIGHELGLTAQRLAWLAASQALLFNVWNSDDPKPGLTLSWVIAIVAVASTALALVATHSAHEVLHSLVEARGVIDARLRDIAGAASNQDFADRAIPFLCNNRRDELAKTEVLGSLPPRVLPPLFLGAWTALILERCLPDDLRVLQPMGAFLVFALSFRVRTWSARALKKWPWLTGSAQ